MIISETNSLYKELQINFINPYYYKQCSGIILNNIRSAWIQYSTRGCCSVLNSELHVMDINRLT